MSTIYKDGVHDITNAEYHSSTAYSRSQLMLLNKSPYHFWYEVLSGDAPVKEQTPAMITGSLFHTLLLEPEKFDKEYIVMPKIDRRTNKGKEEYHQFEIQAENKIILSGEQHEKTLTMVEQVKKHEIVQDLLNDAVFEQSIFWTDKDTGLQFKTRPDIWSERLIVDLKTTADASPRLFIRSALNYGYYLQAGMAFEACNAIGKPIDEFLILACEKEPPYVPAVFVIDKEAIQFGIDQFNAYKNKLKHCLDNNKWPGYPVQELGIPKYATINEEVE